jgi:hypothetical protein
LKPWTLSASGRRVVLDPDSPDFNPGQFSLIDVATHLSRMIRYNGAVDWSVAAHSILAASLATVDNQPRNVVRAVLMHDGHEAYTGDVISPVRQVVGEAWKTYEDKFQAAFLRAMGLTEFHEETVRVYDLLALSCEKEHFFDTQIGYTDWGKLPDPSLAQKEVACALLSVQSSQEIWAHHFYAWGAMLGFPVNGQGEPNS